MVCAVFQQPPREHSTTAKLCTKQMGRERLTDRDRETEGKNGLSEVDRTWTLKSEISVRIVALLFTTVLYVCAIELAGVEGGKEERPGAGSPLLALVRGTAVVMLKHTCR